MGTHPGISGGTADLRSDDNGPRGHQLGKNIGSSQSEQAWFTCAGDSCNFRFQLITDIHNSGRRKFGALAPVLFTMDNPMRVALDGSRWQRVVQSHAAAVATSWMRAALPSWSLGCVCRFPIPAAFAIGDQGSPMALHPLILIGAPTAFQPECPTVMYRASKPASRNAIAVRQPT